MGGTRGVPPTPAGRRLALRFLPFPLLDLQPLLANVQPQPSEEAHVRIRDPDEAEECRDQPAPIWIEQVKTGCHERGERHPVAEAILAGEDVKELAPEEGMGRTAAPHAVLARLAE